MFTRRLGRSGIEISALGLGTARIGGLGWDRLGDLKTDFHQSDVDESIRAIRRALELGVTFFDTADAYGCGHSERILGRALAGWRDKVVLATKFGNTFDEGTVQGTGPDASREYIRRACEASLRRLNSDYIDLYQLHLRDYDLQLAVETRKALEELVDEGKIRFYGWSTDDVERARFFAQGPHCTAVQHRLNIFQDNPGMLQLCEEYDLASINRVPLAMGVLTGKFTPETRLPQDDRRSDFFKVEEFLQDLEKVQKLRGALTRDGRTYTQGALGWIWKRSERTIPIPGFRTVAQVEENAGAMEFGPLDSRQVTQINELLGRSQA
jgi:aryl-alcohol dehydrogenase-like predicted oxidoreductase